MASLPGAHDKHDAPVTIPPYHYHDDDKQYRPSRNYQSSLTDETTVGVIQLFTSKDRLRFQIHRFPTPPSNQEQE